MLYVPWILLDIITVLPRASLRRGVSSMNIQQLPVSSLINYEFNARRHDQTQIDRIATSIKEFGFNQPVVVDESNIILVGHGRVAAARKLGLDKIPVLKKEGLTEAQKWAELIKNSSKAGEVVLDTFLGSGTTLIACEQLNRTCYGMEIEPKYCHVIIERYRKHCTDNNKPFECKVNGQKYE